MAGSATGAMSWAFITALKKNPQQSYVQLLNSIRDELQGRYSQKPQLSCSHPLSKTNLLTGKVLALTVNRHQPVVCNVNKLVDSVNLDGWRWSAWTDSGDIRRDLEGTGAQRRIQTDSNFPTFCRLSLLVHLAPLLESWVGPLFVLVYAISFDYVDAYAKTKQHVKLSVYMAYHRVMITT